MGGQLQELPIVSVHAQTWRDQNALAEAVICSECDTLDRCLQPSDLPSTSSPHTSFDWQLRLVWLDPDHILKKWWCSFMQKNFWNLLTKKLTKMMWKNQKCYFWIISLRYGPTLTINHLITLLILDGGLNSSHDYRISLGHLDIRPSASNADMLLSGAHSG